jgi:hypothetical protein
LVLSSVSAPVPFGTTMMDSPYAGTGERENLESIIIDLNRESNVQRPYAKTVEGNRSQRSSNIAKNTFLTES